MVLASRMFNEVAGELDIVLSVHNMKLLIVQIGLTDDESDGGV